MRKRKAILECRRWSKPATQLSLTAGLPVDAPGTRVGVGYNVQIAVDTRHNLIAEQQVHSKVSDLGLLAETAVAARETWLDEIDAVADRGYFKIDTLRTRNRRGHALRADADRSRPDAAATL